jgi:hypothetical protein
VKYETVLNMTTAKALGLDVPTSNLLSADERNSATQEDWIADGGNGSNSALRPRRLQCPVCPKSDIVDCPKGPIPVIAVGRVTGVTEHAPEDALLRLDVGRPDHLAPFVGVFGNELCEVSR